MKGWVWVTRQRHEVMGHTAETRFLPLLSHMKVKEKKVKSLSYVQLFATPWTVAYLASPSMALSRQEYWSIPGKNTGVSFLCPGDLPNPGIEPGSPAL